MEKGKSQQATNQKHQEELSVKGSKSTSDNVSKRKSSSKHACDLCQASFTKPESLVRHKKLHLQYNPKNEPCLKCGEHCTSRLNWHFKYHNKICIKLAQCHLCDEKFSKVLSAINHFAFVHSEKNLNACKVCGKMYRERRDLLKHFAKNHSEVDKRYPCDTCQYVAKHIHDLKVHKRGMHREKIHKCDQCDEAFRLPSALRLHNERVHLKIKYMCNHCGKIYLNKPSLIEHEKTHKTDKPLHCDQCDYKTNTTYNLYNHKRRNHVDIGNFKCNECGRVFKRMENLNKHIKSHNPQEKCDDCGKLFPSKQTLSQHKRMHLPDKPFRCEICGDKFTYKQNLDSHMNTHSDVKPFSCDQCSMTFVRKGNLTQHLKTHSDVKPYSCDQCSLTFRLPHHLRNHINSNHLGLKRKNDQAKSSLKISKTKRTKTSVSESYSDTDTEYFNEHQNVDTNNSAIEEDVMSS